MSWRKRLGAFKVWYFIVVVFSYIQQSNQEHVCNFDSGLCSGWSQSNQDDFDWTRGKGATLTHNTGPASGHGGDGGYMYIDVYFQKNNDVAKLEFSVPSSDIGKKSCLKFYYHMYGEDINTLNVFNGNTKVFTKSGNQGNVWLTAKFTLTLQSIVMFEGIRGANIGGDIAIDDVSIVDGICQDCSTTLNESFGQIELRTTRSSDLQCDWKIQSAGIHGAVAFLFVEEIALYKRSEFVKIDDGNGSEVLSHLGCENFASEIFPEVSFGFRNNISIQSYTQTRGRGFKMKFAILKKSLTSAIPLLGWNITVIHLSSTGFTLQWINLSTVVNEYARFYMVELRSIQDFVLTEEMFPGNITTTVIKGLSPSTKYRLVVFGVDGTGLPYRSLESVITTKKVSCGFRNVSASLAPVDSWPWQVMVTNSSGVQSCSGSLVDPYWVVTAAHCVAKKTSSAIKIRLGAHYRRNGSVGTEQDIDVAKIIIHENHSTPLSDSNDIALINLASPAKPGPGVGLICFPDTDHDLPFDNVNKTCSITGWGTLSSGGSQPNSLMQAAVSLVSNQRCKSAYPGQIDDTMLCAGKDEGGVDHCQGDSGGPLVCEFNGTWYLEGVAARANTCTQAKMYGVYAKVRGFKSWLSKHMYLYAVNQPIVSSQNLSYSGALVWCNFENGLCSGWSQSSSDDFDWTLASGSTSSSSTGPTAGQGGSGNYMYIEASYPRKPGENAKLVVTVPNNGNPGCLSFYYHMYGSSAGTLNVYSANTKLFSVSGNQGNKWLIAEKTLYLEGTVTFEGIIGSSYKGDIAIDRAKITEEECTVSCNFDNGLESCFGWTQSNSDTFDWKLSSASTPSKPSSDISGKGKFMYMDASTQSAGDNAKLQLAVSRSNSSSCLTFYYHMDGWSVGTLNVINGNVVIFSKSGNQGNRWRKGTITLQLSNILTFEGIVESYRNNIIAIDNVTVSKGECPVPISSCDFDEGLCDGWRQSNSDVFDWTRQTTFTPTFNTGPWSDHTSGSGYYMFIETDLPRVAGDNAKLEVSVPGNGQSSCLEFYYHMYGDSMGTLTVFSGNAVVFKASGNHGNRWIKAERTIHLDNIVIFEGIRGASSTGDLAIDDVLITNGSCQVHTATLTFYTTSTSAFSWSSEPSTIRPSTVKSSFPSNRPTFTSHNVTPSTFKPSTVRPSMPSEISTFNTFTRKSSLTTVLSMFPASRPLTSFSVTKPSLNLDISTFILSTGSPSLSTVSSTFRPSIPLTFRPFTTRPSLSSDLSKFTLYSAKPPMFNPSIIEPSTFSPSSVRPSLPSDPSNVKPSLSSDLSTFIPSTVKPSFSSEPSTFEPSNAKPTFSLELSTFSLSSVTSSLSSSQSNAKPSLSSDESTFSPSRVKSSLSSGPSNTKSLLSTKLFTFSSSTTQPSLSSKLSTLTLLSSGALMLKFSTSKSSWNLYMSTCVPSNDNLSSELSTFILSSSTPLLSSNPSTFSPLTSESSLSSQLDTVNTVSPVTVNSRLTSVLLTFKLSIVTSPLDVNRSTLSPSVFKPSLSSMFRIPPFTPSTGKTSMSLELFKSSLSSVWTSLPSNPSTFKSSLVLDESTLIPLASVKSSFFPGLSTLAPYTAKPSSFLDTSTLRLLTAVKQSSSSDSWTHNSTIANPLSSLHLHTLSPSPVRPTLNSSVFNSSSDKSLLLLGSFTTLTVSPSLSSISSTLTTSSAKSIVTLTASTFLSSTGKLLLSKGLSTIALSTAKPSSSLAVSAFTTSTINPSLSSNSPVLEPYTAPSSLSSGLSTPRPSTVASSSSSRLSTLKPSITKASLFLGLSVLSKTPSPSTSSSSSSSSMLKITTIKPPSLSAGSPSTMPTSGLPDSPPTTNPATSTSSPSARTPSAEEIQNAIMLEVEDLIIEKWNEEIEVDFKREVAKIATDYCAALETGCQLTSASSRRKRSSNNMVFTSDMVHILQGYPKTSPDDPEITLLAFYLILHQESSDSIVNRDVLKAMVESDLSGLEATISGTNLRVRGLSTTVNGNENDNESDEESQPMSAIIGAAVGNGLLLLIICAIVFVIRRRIRSKKESAEETPNNNNNDAYNIDSGELAIEMVRTCLSGLVPDKELEGHCHERDNVLYVAADEIWRKESYENSAYCKATKMQDTCSCGVFPDKELEEPCQVETNVLYVAADQIWRKECYYNRAYRTDSKEKATGHGMKENCSCGVFPDKEHEEQCQAKNNVLYVAADDIWRKASYENSAYNNAGPQDQATKTSRACTCGILPDKDLEEQYQAKNNVLYVSADEIWKKRTCSKFQH